MRNTLRTAAILLLAGMTTSVSLAQSDALTVKKERITAKVEHKATNAGQVTDRSPESVKRIVESMKEAKKAAIDKPAPDFLLVDYMGKEHRLSDYTAKGMTVVLEWINPTCPYVMEHYNTEGKGTSTTVEKEFAGQKVAWLRINSGKAETIEQARETNAEVAKNWKVTSPILLDTKGTVGRAYNAKVTPTLFVINNEGIIAYEGAMDSERSPSKTGEIIYPRDALRAVLANETVTTKTTNAVGCGIKYAPKTDE